MFGQLACPLRRTITDKATSTMMTTRQASTQSDPSWSVSKGACCSFGHPASINVLDCTRTFSRTGQLANSLSSPFTFFFSLPTRFLSHEYLTHQRRITKHTKKGGKVEKKKKAIVYSACSLCLPGLRRHPWGIKVAAWDCRHIAVVERGVGRRDWRDWREGDGTAKAVAGRLCVLGLAWWARGCRVDGWLVGAMAG